MSSSYTIPETAELNKLLTTIDDFKLQIDRQKPLQPTLMFTIQEKLRVEWTYNSNAIEGSTLTRRLSENSKSWYNKNFSPSSIF